MPEIKVDGKLRRRAAEALAEYAEQMFEKQDGEWTAVVTFGHAGRSEDVKTQDDEEYLERKAKLRALDLEIVTGPWLKQAEEARDGARHQRLTVGTLLSDAFRRDDTDR